MNESMEFTMFYSIFSEYWVGKMFSSGLLSIFIPQIISYPLMRRIKNSQYAFSPKGRPENVLKLLCQSSWESHFNWSPGLISQVAFLLNWSKQRCPGLGVTAILHGICVLRYCCSRVESHPVVLHCWVAWWGPRGPCGVVWLPADMTLATKGQGVVVGVPDWPAPFKIGILMHGMLWWCWGSVGHPIST